MLVRYFATGLNMKTDIQADQPSCANDATLIADDRFLSEMGDRLRRLRALMSQPDRKKAAKPAPVKRTTGLPN